jgi:hypothetical protein
VDRVAFAFSKGDIELPIKENLDDEEASTTKRGSPYVFSRASCSILSMTDSGAVTLNPPAVIIDDHDTFIPQTSSYADYIMYADFHRPFFGFEVRAFKQAATSTSASCTPTAAEMASAVTANFSEPLCFTEDEFCNYWVGQDGGDGWVYFGGNGSTRATADFGVRVQPRWNWTGTREYFEINSTNLINVRPVASFSDAAGKFTLSKTQSVPWEFEKCNITADGAVVFNMDENGFLVRYLSCNSLALDDYAHLVFDFANKFDETKMAVHKLPDEADGKRWNFTLTTFRVKFGSPSSILVGDRTGPFGTYYIEPYVEINRLPPGYELDGINWLTTLEIKSFGEWDLVKTWFTIFKPNPSATTSTSTSTAATTTRPTQAPPKLCPQGCSSSGTCDTTTGTCTCAQGFVADPVSGCKAIIETTTTPPPGATTTTLRTVVQETVAVTQPPSVVQTVEPTVPVDTNQFTGTFTGTKAPVATRPGVPGATPAPTVAETTSASQLVLSAGALLLSAPFLFF